MTAVDFECDGQVHILDPSSLVFNVNEDDDTRPRFSIDIKQVDQSLLPGVFDALRICHFKDDRWRILSSPKLA